MKYIGKNSFYSTEKHKMQKKNFCTLQLTFFYNFMNPLAPLDTPHPVTIAVVRVAGNRQLFIEMNEIVSLYRCMSLVVWTGFNIASSPGSRVKWLII